MKKAFNPHGIRPDVSFLLLALALWLGCTTQPVRHFGWEDVPAFAETIIPPVFPDREFVITRFGAVGDGKTDCSAAIARAIDTCAASGGGHVVVPEGRFLTGAVHLLDNVDLHLARNAILLFMRDTRRFPLVLTRFEGAECMNFSPFVYACDRQNVALTGEGTLDGQADSTLWWPWTGKTRFGWKEGMPEQKTDRASLFDMAEKGVPAVQRIFGEGHLLRTNFVQFYRCRSVLVEGVTLRRSPMWGIHPVLCENVVIRNARVMSRGPNNDGCNPESCRNVLISGCIFDTGDDCIAIKSGRNADGRRVNVASENIVIRDCVMQAGHGGVVIGSEISGSCRNVFVEDCTMDSADLDWAVRIKTNSRRGGIVEGIHMRNVRLGDIRDSIIGIYFNYEEGDVGNHTPIVRNLFFDHITSRKSQYVLYLEGYRRSPISNVILEECNFNGVQKQDRLNHVSRLRMRNVTINGQRQ